MKNIVKLFLITLALSLISDLSSEMATAEEVCKVTDPTGTPLNVRTDPNGRIIMILKNDMEVYIHRIEYDEQGRPWALIGRQYRGQYKILGWVFREFISCYQR